VLFSQLHPTWQVMLADQRELLEEIASRLNREQNVVPQQERILAAFATDPADQRVLIIGQDPYPNPSHATGLAFAVPPGTQPLPPTLANIYRDLSLDVGAQAPALEGWAERGVLLLNRHLTTRAGESAAHLQLGWQGFTAAAVSALADLQGRNLVAILWGRKAQELAPLLGEASVISSPHPSPLSSYRGFFGSRPFSGANAALVDLGLAPIDWSANA
jgi:uracil-DNA glycosylase